MTRWVRVAIALLLTLAVAACSGGGSSPTSRPTEAPTSEPTSEPTDATLAVPDIVDETEQDGLVALGAAGLAAGARSRAYSDDFDSGRIVSTDPKAGVIVARGTAIDYVVSRGPRPTPSPTAKATAKPTATPTAKPTARPTAGPTSEPTLTPATPPATEPVPTTAPVELPLPGTAWVLAATVDDASTTVDLPRGLAFTAAFSDTDISGTVVCNQFSGPYAVEPDGRITIGELAVTAMACADDDGTAQTQYLSALRASTGYQATDTRLQLTADDGTQLVYAPAPSASPSPSLPPG